MYLEQIVKQTSSAPIANGLGAARTFLNSIRPRKLVKAWPRSKAACGLRLMISSMRAAAAEAAAFELIVAMSCVTANTLYMT
jgi:hypothetical protein